jgi:hypothetical protein
MRGGFEYACGETEPEPLKSPSAEIALRQLTRFTGFLLRVLGRWAWVVPCGARQN